MAPRTGKAKFVISPFAEVIVTRDSDCARIEYKEGGSPASLLKIGPERREMSDREIVELHMTPDKARRASQYKQVAIEMPLGSAQIEYFCRCDQMGSRSTVLRCLSRTVCGVSD